jgi:hypothetical protein
MCDGSGRNFSTVARKQVPMVRKRRAEGNATAVQRAVRSRSVHSTTLATLAEQNRCQVGPTILFDRPRQEPPSLTSFVSLWARPAGLQRR